MAIVHVRWHVAPTKDTSPKTGATLESKTLIPNHLVRSMILAFNEAGAAL